MANAEAFCYQAVLRRDHIAVVVARKFRPHTVGRLGRFSVADGVGQHYEVLARVQRLTWTKQFTPEGGSKQAGARAGGAMKDQHGMNCLVQVRRWTRASTS